MFLPVFLPFYIYMLRITHPPVCPSVRLSVRPSVRLRVLPFIKSTLPWILVFTCVCLFISACISAFLHLYVMTCSPTSQPTHPSVHLSIHISVPTVSVSHFDSQPLCVRIFIYICLHIYVPLEIIHPWRGRHSLMHIDITHVDSHAWVHSRTFSIYIDHNNLCHYNLIIIYQIMKSTISLLIDTVILMSDLSVLT